MRLADDQTQHPEPHAPVPRTLQTVNLRLLAHRDPHDEKPANLHDPAIHVEAAAPNPRGTRRQAEDHPGEALPLLWEFRQEAFVPA